MSSSSIPDSTPGSPTNIRYFVVLSTALMSVLLYLDRFCIGFAEIYIKEELSLTDVQVGFLISAFFWTYALAQVPSGWLTDRFGSRVMLTMYILAWSLCTGLIGAAYGFVMLLMLRFGLGLGQAGAYPTGASIVSKWVPFHARGTASSIVALGGRVGGVLALIGTGYLIVWLTPMSTPTAIKSNDLLDVPQLCYELHTKRDNDKQENARLQVWNAMSPETQTIVAREARRYEVPLKNEKKELEDQGKDPGKAAPVVEPPPANDIEKLATDLTTATSRIGVFDYDDVREYPLEKEARRLFNADERTLQQERRMNRFVMEAMHRDSVRKIYGQGWRPVMYIYGSLGLLVAALIWFCTRNRPTDHPRCNELEVKLIAGDKKPLDPAKKVGGIPLIELIKSRSMWMSCISQWFTNIGWLPVIAWGARYLDKVHEIPTETRAFMIAIPPFVGWAGMMLGGVATDWMATTFGLRWGRALPFSISRFTAMAAYIALLFSPSAWLAVAMFSVVTFSTNVGTASSWAFSQDVGGRKVGSVLGWGNMWGNLGAAVTPPVLIWIVGENQNWNAAFTTCAAAFFIAGVAALWLDASIPIVRDDEDEKEK